MTLTLPRNEVLTVEDIRTKCEALGPKSSLFNEQQTRSYEGYNGSVLKRGKLDCGLFFHRSSVVHLCVREELENVWTG